MPAVVYGGDHSPWVQSVLLGLHERGVPHTVLTVPPLPVFVESGILMPVARLDDGPWIRDSARILGELGFSPVADEDRAALQRLFRGGALQRTVQPWDFWYRWSFLRDGRTTRLGRLWNHLRRPFSVFYFFVLITLGRLRQRRRSDAELADDFAWWERRLEPVPAFLGGESPDTVDLQLFGQLQMFASVPGRSLRVIQEHPGLERLRAWIGRMQARFASYPHLYSGPHFEPRSPAPECAPAVERAAYWAGTALVWIAWPLSLAATLFFARRVGKKGLR